LNGKTGLILGLVEMPLTIFVRSDADVADPRLTLQTVPGE